MKSARSWALALLRRSERATLDAALLTGRGARYVSSRVSIVGIRAVLRTVVHAAEIAILSRDFPFEFLTPLFAMRALPALVTGVQWGALEALRVQVRQEASDGRAGLARAQIECWLGWTLLIAGSLAMALTLRVSHNSLEYGPDGLYGSFAILSVWVLVSELGVRTYHAGVFALGRVYRPAWSLFVPDLLEVGLLVQTYPRLGPFALHLIVLVGTLLRLAITVRYSRQAYRTRLHETPRPLRLRSLARLSGQDVWQGTKHALATLPQQLDRMLLVALLRSPAPDDLSLPLSLPYYALRPLANFAQAWVRTFYADFVRLDVASVTVLRMRFERLLLRVSLVTGALSALLVIAGSCFLFGAAGLGPALWLTPLSLLRSRFALEQTRAFTYHDLPTLLRSSAILVPALLVPWLVHVSDRVMLAVVLVALAVAAVLFGRAQSRAKERRMLLAQRLPVSAWLASLAREQRPVRLGIALADSKVGRPYALLTVLANRLGHGRAARFGKTWLMWWEPQEQAASRVELVTLLGGAAQKLELVDGATGKDALLNALAAKQLPYDLTQALTLPSALRSHDALKERARTLVPGVLTLDARNASPDLARLSSRELSILRRALIAEAREQDIVPSFSPWQAAVFAPDGEAELVFIFPARTPQAGLLKRHLRHASWRCSVS